MKLFLLTLMLATHGVMVQAAGTIAFANGPLTPVGGTVPVPATVGVLYGVFWGTNRNDLALALPLGSNSTTTAGRIVAPAIYHIAGTEGGQTVYLQIKGWSAAYGTNWVEARNDFASFGETRIIQVTLGPEAGPGTVIWQGSTATDPNRFHPLILGAPLTPPAVVTFAFPPYISSITVDEGSHGSVEAVFSVIRVNMSPNPLDYPSSVLLSTSNMTAVAGQDYMPTNLVVTFAPGEIQKTVRITVTGDEVPEADEQFAVRMSGISFVATSAPLVVNIREARVLSARRAADHVVVSIQTTGRQGYALESSTDLASWSLVPGAESIQGTGGVVEVTDATPDCCGARFYRTQILP